MSKKTTSFNTNGRVISEMLTKYRDTFRALTELINNSIQAESTEIKLNIDYGISTDPLNPLIKSIEIIDNGKGICSKDFEKKIFEIGTTVKSGGQGVGRFSALQIG